MPNRPLNTHDLAGETNTRASDPQTNLREPTPDRRRFSDPAGDGEAAAEKATADEQPRRERSENEQPDNRSLDGKTEAVGAEPDVEPLSGHQSRLESSPTGLSVGEGEALLPDDQSERFNMRWHEIQTSFVDQPRDSVQQADALVADLMQRLAASFSNERERLEAQWDRGDDVSTEDLRVALTRYRSFFDRLLSA